MHVQCVQGGVVTSEDIGKTLTHLVFKWVLRRQEEDERYMHITATSVTSAR